MKHYGEEEMILHHYGEDGENPALDEHLEACEACKKEYETLRRTFAAVDSVTVPERDAAYPQRVMRRVEAALAEPPRSSWWVWLTPMRFSMGAAVAALLVAAFFIGERHGQTALTDEVRQRILMLAVGEHLQSSERMLLELSNADATRGVDLTDQRDRAEMLASANRLYRRTADHRGRTDVVDLLDELERVLLEIANSPEKLTPAEFNAMWRRIESRGLLIRMRIIESEAREHRPNDRT